jgi:hypothetical protein
MPILATTVTTVLLALATPSVASRQAPPETPSRPSPSDRATALARRLVNDLLPPGPDRGRILAALEVAGLPAPGDETTAAVVATAVEAYAEWRAAEEPSLAAALAARATDAAGRGSPIGPEIVADVVRRWDGGFRFERDALDDLVSSLAAPPSESDVAIARHALAAAEMNALFGRVPLGTIDLNLDLVRESSRCAAGTEVTPARIRELLGGYAKERADHARMLAERRLATMSRGGEVAIAVQAWFSGKSAGGGAAADPAEMQGLGIVLQMAPMVGAAGEWQDLQRRGASVLETALPPDAAWCVWASLPPGGAAIRETVDRLAAAVATMPEDRRNAAETALREFRNADLATIKELLASEIETGKALGKILAPALEPGGLAKLDLDAFSASLTGGEIRATGSRLEELQAARLAKVTAFEAALASPSPPAP